MRRMVFLTTASKLTCALLVISPASTTRLSFTSVSAATREVLSCFRIASSTASDIWSATLSGWPSDTDSEVNRKSLIARGSFGEGRKDTKFAPLTDGARAPLGRYSARVPARVGKRPRMGDVWDIAHLPAPSSRKPRAGRLPRSAHPAGGDRRRGTNGARAAGDLVSPP